MLLQLTSVLILVAEVVGIQNEEMNNGVTKREKGYRNHNIQMNEEDSPWSDTYLPRHIIPNSYQLKLQPFGEDGYFQGYVNINISCLKSTNRVILHAHEDLQIDRESLSVRKLNKKVQQVAETLKRTNREIKISRVRRNFTNQQYKIILERKLKKGSMYQLALNFTSDLSNESDCAFCIKKQGDQTTQNSSWFVVTQMRPGNARQVFPCFDEPRHKAFFTLSIARQGTFKSLSNMAVYKMEKMKHNDGWIWDHFSTTPPMSSSSLLILIFNSLAFHEITPLSPPGSISISGFTQPRMINKLQEEVERVIHVIPFLEKYLNMSFPLPQLKLIVLPQISTTATTGNYWGIILFDEDELKEQDLPWHLLNALSSQWIGHLVTPEHCSSIYASNVLAEYLSLISSLDSMEHSKYDSAINWKPDDHYTLYNDFSKVNASSISKKLQGLKYSWIVSMLSHALTANTFQQALRNFVTKRAFKTFKEVSFWNNVNKQAWKDNTLDRNNTVHDIVASWLRSDRYPVVTVLRNYSNNSALIKQEIFVRRWPYKISGQESTLWWVPIMYLTQDNLDVHNITFITWMKQEKEIYVEDLPDDTSFIIINPEDIGMFIVNYDYNNWNMLAEYLIASGVGDGQPLIPPATRAKLLHNAWYLALGNRLDFAIALNMTLFLKSETELPVWKALSQIYFTVSWKLVGTNAETKFDRFIGEMLIPIYESNGNCSLHEYDPRAEIMALAHYILCKAGYKPAVSRAKLYFELWLMDPKEIDGGNIWSVVRWMDDEWETGLQRVIELLGNATGPDLRRFLLTQLISSTIQPRRQERLLKILLLDEEYAFTDSELKAAFGAIIDYKAFLTFITHNWKPIKKRFERKIDMWHYILEHATKNVKTQEGYDLVEEFYKANIEKLGNSSRIIKHSLQMIKTNVEGMYRNIPTLETWLDHYLHSNEGDADFYSM